jgi:hypothetical protein
MSPAMAFRPAVMMGAVIEELFEFATIPVEIQSIGLLIQGCDGEEEFAPGTVG